MLQKVRVLFLLLGLCWFCGQGAFLYAQEDDYDDDDEDEDSGYDDGLYIESDWDGYISDLYTKGDQTFTISAGVVFPLAFINNGTKLPNNFTPPVGGAIGPLAYTYFLNSHFFLGAEIGFDFIFTLGQNTAFFIPVGARAGWQFIYRKFEFPLNATIGMVIQRYLNDSYLGLFIKGAGAAYFRFSPSWSFGLGADFNWYPQWPEENGKRTPQKDVDGFFAGVTLAARYHF